MPAISIILPSYNDYRVLRSIESIINFDDTKDVEIVLIDGGSNDDLKKDIVSNLRDSDQFIYEKDKGIFDALNKGLNKARGEIIGWLGSDDFFSKELKASYIKKEIYQFDLFIMSMVHFRENKISRITPSWPQKYGLIKYGINNPHFSTFGKKDLLMKESFAIDDPAADIEYFLKIFSRKPSINTSNTYGVFMSEGGFSTSSRKFIIKNNFRLIKIYYKYSLLGIFSPFIKIIFKIMTMIPFIVVKKDIKI